MKKIIFVSGLAILLAGCNEGQVEEVSAAVETPDPEVKLDRVGDKKDCPGSNGPNIVIRYGDSNIEVTHKVEVKSNGRLILKLHPNQGPPQQEIDHNKTLITLAGKDAKSAWINASLLAPETSPEKVSEFEKNCEIADFMRDLMEHHCKGSRNSHFIIFYV